MIIRLWIEFLCENGTITFEKEFLSATKSSSIYVSIKVQINSGSTEALN